MVNYYSDATGFHAKVFSNEPGILPRRDHVNSVNRELFAKQTPLAYNPANVEWVINSNQPDFSRLNTLASEYNGNWRSNNDLNSQLYRDQYAINGEYSGAASQVVESRRLNSLNSNQYENERPKLSLLVVPKVNPVISTARTIISSKKQEIQENNFKPTNSHLNAQRQVPSQPSRQQHPVQILPSNDQIQVPKQVHQPIIVNEVSPAPLNENRNVVIEQSAPQSLPIIRQPIATSIQQPNQPDESAKKKRRRVITGVRRVTKKAKDHTYFNNNPKIELIPRKGEISAIQSDDIKDVDLKEFSNKFPEKFHQIFSGKAFNQNGIYEDKANQYAQLEAVRPDVSVLADQSFMKPIAKREKSSQKLSATKKTDRVGALPRKSVQYVPPITNSETLLTSATVNSNTADQTSSPRLIPRMINSNPPTSTVPTIIKNNKRNVLLNNNKVQQSTTAAVTTKSTIQSSTPTTLLSSSASTINPSSTIIANSSSTKGEKLDTTTTMSPTTASSISNMNNMNETKKETIKNEIKEKVKLTELINPTTQINTTELPLLTSTSVSIVTSTSVDQRKKDDLKTTISPISKVKL